MNLSDRIRVSLPELGLIAATRAFLGAGAALLMTNRLDPERRKTLGWTLFFAGAVTTVPILIEVLSALKKNDEIASGTHSRNAQSNDNMFAAI